MDVWSWRELYSEYGTLGGVGVVGDLFTLIYISGETMGYRVTYASLK